MKNLSDYIYESRNEFTLDLSDKEFEILDKYVNYDFDKDTKKVLNDNDVDFIISSTSTVKNQFNAWKKIKNGGKFGYWTRTSVREFTKTVIEEISTFVCLLVTLDKLNISKNDFDVLMSINDKCINTLPNYKGLNKEDTLEVINKIVNKYNKDNKIKVGEEDGFIYIDCGEQPDDWHKILNELEDYKMDNTVLGDGYIYNIYIHYVDKK